MRPILIKIGSLTIYSYGFMLAVAFLSGTLLARYEARRRGIDPDIVFDLVLLIALAGIVGARLFYVIGHLAARSGVLRRPARRGVGRNCVCEGQAACFVGYCRYDHPELGAGVCNRQDRLFFEWLLLRRGHQCAMGGKFF